MRTWSEDPCAFPLMVHWHPSTNPILKCRDKSVECPHLALEKPPSLLSRGGFPLPQCAMEDLEVVCYVGESRRIYLIRRVGVECPGEGGVGRREFVNIPIYCG